MIKKILKPTGILTISNGLTRLIGMLFFVFLARLLTVSEYGLFRYLITLSLVFAIFFTGFPNSLTVFISKNKKNKKIYSEYTFLTLVLVLSIYFILCLIILIFEKNQLYLILFLFSALIDFTYIGYIRGLLNYTKLAGFKLLENVIQLSILIIFFIFYKKIDLTLSVIFFSFSGVISLIIFESVKPEIKIAYKISIQKIKNIVKYTIPITIGSVGWMIMFGTNAIFIKYYFGTEQVAFYSVGETMVQVFSFLPAAFITILLPKVSELKNSRKITRLTRFAVFSTLITSIIILFILIIFKDKLILWIFSNKYILASSVILPLSLAYIFISIHQIYSSVFQGLNKPSVGSITILIAAILNVILSFLLTPELGILGSAISLMTSAFFAMMCIVFIFIKYSKANRIREKQ
jgi:O-antigen/teichoic acid export membrane protein